MEIKGLNTNRIDALNKLANQLLENDDDKQIQSSELKKFIEQNEAEFISLQIDPETAAKELKSLLGASYNEASEKTENPVDSKSTDGSTKDAETIKNQIRELQEELDGYNTEKVALNQKKTELENTIKQKNEEFKELERTISEKNEEQKRIIEEINKATENMKEDVALKHRQAAYDAMSKYNPEKDGEWSDYITKYMSGKDFDSAFVSVIKDLTSKSEFNTCELSSLGAKFSSLGIEMESLNCELEDTVCKISDLETKICETTTSITDCLKELAKATEKNTCGGSGGNCDVNPEQYQPDTQQDFKELTKWLYSYIVGTDGPGNNGTKPNPTTVENKDDVWSKIPESERKLAEELGIDLTEKLEDGTPRYIFAKGTYVDEGDTYHMYDMGKNNDRGDNALVRLECGYDDNSFDQIPNGNGGIRPGSFSYCDEECEDCQPVYYMDDCDTMCEAPATYETKSPLSFDLNGDGVKTSSKVIDYDIDGDGIVDKINDSADAVLVFDKDGDGISGKDGSETFGDNTDLDGDGKADGYKDGFEALKALAKKEGLINGEDDNELDEKDLKVLEEKHGLKIKTNGYNSEAKSLSDTGITSIKLSKDNETSLEDNFDGNGNQLMTQKGATFTVNGEEKEYADIWHKKYNEDESSNFFMGNSSIASKINSVMNEIDEANALSSETNAIVSEEKNKAKENGKNIFSSLIKNIPEHKIKKQVNNKN